LQDINAAVLLLLLLLLCCQVCEERIAELSSRLASQESKVSQLKSERQELYQKLAAAAEATRNQVRGNRTQEYCSCLGWQLPLCAVAVEAADHLQQ
jgi:outer membrane murein-binding lipoprotein Lpp